MSSASDDLVVPAWDGHWEKGDKGAGWGKLFGPIIQHRKRLQPTYDVWFPHLYEIEKMLGVRKKVFIESGTAHAAASGDADAEGEGAGAGGDADEERRRREKKREERARRIMMLRRRLERGDRKLALGNGKEDAGTAEAAAASKTVERKEEVIEEVGARDEVGVGKPLQKSRSKVLTTTLSLLFYDGSAAEGASFGSWLKGTLHDTFREGQRIVALAFLFMIHFLSCDFSFVPSRERNFLRPGTGKLNHLDLSGLSLNPPEGDDASKQMPFTAALTPKETQFRAEAKGQPHPGSFFSAVLFFFHLLTDFVMLTVMLNLWDPQLVALWTPWKGIYKRAAREDEKDRERDEREKREREALRGWEALRGLRKQSSIAASLAGKKGSFAGMMSGVVSRKTLRQDGDALGKSAVRLDLFDKKKEGKNNVDEVNKKIAALGPDSFLAIQHALNRRRIFDQLRFWFRRFALPIACFQTFAYVVMPSASSGNAARAKRQEQLRGEGVVFVLFTAGITTALIPWANIGRWLLGFDDWRSPWKSMSFKVPKEDSEEGEKSGDGVGGMDLHALVKKAAEMRRAQKAEEEKKKAEEGGGAAVAAIADGDEKGLSQKTEEEQGEKIAKKSEEKGDAKVTGRDRWTALSHTISDAQSTAKKAPPCKPRTLKIAALSTLLLIGIPQILGVCFVVLDFHLGISMSQVLLVPN